MATAAAGLAKPCCNRSAGFGQALVRHVCPASICDIASKRPHLACFRLLRQRQNLIHPRYGDILGLVACRCVVKSALANLVGTKLGQEIG